MKTIDRILRFGLTLQLALSPFAAFAASPKAKPLSEKQVREKLDRLRVATFDYIANQFMVTRTPEEYETWLVPNLRPDDRKEAVNAFKQIKKLERVRRSMDTLIFQADGQTLKATWPDIRKPTLVINGVTFAYNETQPLKPQVEALLEKITTKNKNALWLQLFPEADAAVQILPILYWVGAAFSGALVAHLSGEALKNGRCYLTQGTALDGDDCINLRKARMESQQAGMPAFDAVKNMSGSDNSNVLSKFEGPKWDRQCPSNNDGKDRFLKTQVRIVKAEGGVKKPTTDWVFVWVKLSPKGDPKDMVITSTPEELMPDNVNTEAGVKRLISHIAFDPTTNRPVSFRIPNPAAQNATGPAGILRSPTLNLNLSMNLTPDQKDIIDNAADIVKWAIFRTYNCVAQEVVAEQQAGIESGSPAQPKADPTKAVPATTQ